MIGLPPKQHPKCLIHDQEAIFINPQSKSQNQKYLCLQCVGNNKKLPVIAELQQNQFNIFTQLEQQYSNCILHLKGLQNQIQLNKNQIIQTFDKVIQLTIQQITNSNQNLQRYKDIFSSYSIQQFETIKEEHSQFIKAISQFKQNVKNQLQNILGNQNFDRLNSQLDELNLQNIIVDEYNQRYNDDQQIQLIRSEWKGQKKEIEIKKYEYKLNEKASVKSEEICKSISINYNNTFVVAGFYSEIKVFQFQNQNLLLHQKIDDIDSQILCLKFMKSSNQFISGDEQSQIRIYDQNNNKIWKIAFILNDHSNSIICLDINHLDNQIISSSNDKTIKFWKNKIQNNWICDQTIKFSDPILSFSLNNLNDILISSDCNRIFIHKLDQNQWQIKQTIRSNQKGFRLCFLDTYQFALQTYEKLEIYQYDQGKDQFQLNNNIQVFNYGLDEGLFPQQFIKSKGLLISKNNYFINIIRKKIKGEFVLEQQIFLKEDSFGTVSNDGQYLLTWDYKSQNISIRKLTQS